MIWKFKDDYETGTLDPAKWSVSVADNAGVGTHTAKSGSYSMFTRWGAVDVTTSEIDLSKAYKAVLRVWIRRGSDEFSEDPDSGEDLVVRYLNKDLVWTDLESFAGDGTPGETFDRAYDLPSDAFHSGFRVRFSQLAGSGSDYDYWHIDDVIILFAPPFASANPMIPILFVPIE